MNAFRYRVVCYTCVVFITKSMKYVLFNTASQFLPPNLIVNYYYTVIFQFCFAYFGTIEDKLGIEYAMGKVKRKNKFTVEWPTSDG